MCGIAGVWSSRAEDIAPLVLTGMTDAVAHRGPDDSGLWVDEEAGIALGHRRLSILDLSPAGHQPMASESGRFVLVFNGEIYNHMDLRADIEKQGVVFAWRGHSDTETLLASVEVWGLETTLKRCVGMFAIALWDRQDRCLILARDRMGEKPLYYGWNGRCFFFASDLAAMRAHPAFRGDINRNALALLMRHNYIPAPHSIYLGIEKLVPGTFACIRHGDRDVRPKPYWSVAEAVAHGLEHPFEGSPAEAVDRLEVLLKDAVARQMIADVPLGAFLSGGIDSSTVVALMQAQSTRPIKTFSIGFHESVYNEASHAKAVAQHLGTDHTEWYVTPQDALDVIPKLPQIYSEPFSDSSQIPTYLVSSLARRHVTVSLSGDAGDELFGGYDRYASTAAYWASMNRVPRAARRIMAQAITSLSAAQWNRLARPLMALLPARYSKRDVGSLAWKGADTLLVDRLEPVYQRVVSHWAQPLELVLGAAEPATMLTRGGGLPECAPIHRMMALDQVSYLPDDILCKVDRAAMAVSLESRVPLLDHRVIEFAWQLPLSYGMRGGVAKWPLREVLARHVPRQLTDRPKMGFGIPIDGWLRGPLRDWAESLLDASRLRQEGFFDPAPIRFKWEEHISGKANWHYHLWDVLMFQAWLEHQRGQRT